MKLLLSTSLQKSMGKDLTHEFEHYPRDSLGLAEVRWTEFGETTMDEEHKIWHHREDSKRQHEVVLL